MGSRLGTLQKGMFIIMPQQKKTTTRKTSAGRTAKGKKRPIRREVGGVVCLILALCVAVSYFQTGAILIDWIAKVSCGLVGYGYYLLFPALLLCAYVLLFHHGRPVAARVVCALLLPLLIGAMVHAAACTETFASSVGVLKRLWSTGIAKTSGGALAGALAIGFLAVLGKVATLIIFTVLTVTMLFVALRLTPGAMIEAVRRHEPVPYEPEPEAPKSAPKAAKKSAVIDIPLDGEEKPVRRTGGFFAKKADHIKSPDELLSEPEARPGEKAETQPPFLHREPKIAATVEAPKPLPDGNQPVSAPEGGAEKIRRAEVEAAAQTVAQEIEAGEGEKPAYRYPPITLLEQGHGGNPQQAGAELRNNSRRLSETLASFGVEAKAGDVVRGPSVTRYEFTLDQGVKLSKITNLQDDIALALGASGVRIAPIPDKISVVGIEVPNKLVSAVHIRDVLESREFVSHKSNVAFAVGKNISGENIIGNIAKLPHVLIAGTTGSGKSVCTNSLIVSLLYKSSPEDVRFIMVDPKMVELAPYNGIPHLLIPVVTDPKKAAGALQWAVYEMMKRYKLFSEHGVKDLAGYNALAVSDETLSHLPTVVVVIDELADLMLVAAKEVEESICRVAQMGRAAGMHLVIATQRPSADVITGLMKANIPSRIAFAVASSLESRIILDNAGAEKLVGRGDMLYAPLGEGKPTRVQGCFISAEEIERVVQFVKENGETNYDKSVIDQINQNVAEREKGAAKGAPAAEDDASSDGDELLPAAVEVVLETGQASVSMLQRRLKLGYSRAARLVDQMESRGIVGPFEGSKPRQLLITREQWQELQMKGGTVPEEPGAETEE